MRRVWIPGRGEPEILEMREEPDPLPGPGQVRVRVAFAGVNFADVMARLGLYPDAPDPPFVPGYEVAGRVDATGEGVDPSWEGRRVAATTPFGGYADVVCLKPDLVFPIPDGVSDDAAAALPVNYLTAWMMLHGMGVVREGDTVLVHGAAGGVGIAAVQLARAAGARVIGTASPGKHDRLREMGVEPVDGRAADWPGRVRALTRERGVDIALDPIGGASFRHSYRLLAPGGRLYCFGVSSMAPGEKRRPLAALASLLRMPRFHPVSLMNDNRSVAGVNLGRLWNETRLLRPALETLLEMAAAGTVRPQVDGAWPLERAAGAHRRLQSRQSVGKILLDARPGADRDAGGAGTP
ncbi:MAG: zinc-binding dehydrogenase [Gemmatimonadota bacterium]|nr:zinc-binding dehydrogenase [Gemmatimonadota bacterium]